MTEQQIQKLIVGTVKGLFAKKIGDTPTDALQLTPKKYVDKQVSSVSSAVSSVVSSVVSSLGRIFEMKVVADSTIVGLGDGKLVFATPQELNSFNLVNAQAFVSTVSSSSALSIQVRNTTTTNDMLTTPISIDQSEFTSYTAATPPVIDTTNSSVLAGNMLAVDVDAAGTGAQGLGVILTFQ